MADASSGNGSLLGVSLDFMPDEVVLSVRAGYGLPEALLRIPERVHDLNKLVSGVEARLKELGEPAIREELAKLGASLFGEKKKEAEK